MTVAAPPLTRNNKSFVINELINALNANSFFFVLLKFGRLIKYENVLFFEL